MKKNLLLLSAVALAIAFSAFTTRPVDVFKYFLYQGGTEKNINSYAAPTTTQPAHVAGTGSVNWFRILDIGNNGISTEEFESATEGFEKYDIVNTSSNLLSDETVDVSGKLDIKD